MHSVFAPFGDAGFRKGIFFSSGSAFMWATVYVLMRALAVGNVRLDPVVLAFLRYLPGGLLFFAICFFTVRKSLFSFTAREYLNIAVLSLFSFVGMCVFLFWGQRYTTAVNASMIMATSPVLTMFLGLFIGERIGLRRFFAMAAGTLGCLMAIGIVSADGFGYSSRNLYGDALILVSSFSWALSAILAKRIVRPDNDAAVTAWSMLFAASVLFVINLCRPGFVSALLRFDTHSVFLSGLELPKVRLYIAYLVLFPTVLGFYFWNAALGRLSLTLVNVMQYLTPVMTVLMAYFFLHENITLLSAGGCALVVGGVLFSDMKRKESSGR